MPEILQSPAEITPELLSEHGITPEEYDRILKALGRTPTMTELGIYSVMWSEHCSYKSSRVHLKRLPTRSKLVLQGPGENAGIIDVGDGWACAFKIESHNHPSFIEPFQGAATGVGGILRDIFTMGARPLTVMDSLRFGPITQGTGDRGQGTGKPDAATIHKNHSILEGVVSGIASYGNCFGVPNLGGETKFEDCYSQNPLVNAFALGLMRKEEIFYAKAAGVGNPVIYVGAKTGRDGIHGATMASEEFKEGSEQKRPNVQVGDPFLEKLLLEACLEAMHTGAVVGIQDMGAAGLTCSTCEMGARGGVGLEIELDNVPQRESGMNSYEIMLSESQERMLLVAEKGRENEVLRVFAKWGLDAVVVGKVVAEPRMKVREHGKIVADIPNESLTDDAPLYKRPMEPWSAAVPKDVPSHVKLGKAGDLTSDLKRMLSAPNICSKKWIFEQYDSMVQTNTVEGPGFDAGVMRIKETNRGLAMSLDCNSRWCYLDPKLGAMHAVAEAARNVACVGARPVAATNCLNFGNPEKPKIMQQFSETIDGLSAACEALGTPITGGNVSLYNETLGEGIYPTPTVGVVGIIDDISKVTRFHFAKTGRDILLIHTGLKPTTAEFGSSEYAKEIHGELWGTAPAIDISKEAKLQALLLELINQRLLESAHDCAEGGIAVALAESAFVGNVGADVDLTSSGLAREIVLFAETASRVVISCDPKNTAIIKEMAVESGVAADRLGQTTTDKLVIRVDGEVAVDAKVSELKQVWETALPSALHVESREHLVPEVLQKS
jgi:phosphoribosylformylglycinamidine synthase subunit PurL